MSADTPRQNDGVTISLLRNISMADVQDPMSPPSHQPSAQPQATSSNLRRAPDAPPSRRTREKLENIVILKRNYYVCFLVFIYAALAIGSWSILCLLSQRPLIARHYNYDHQHSSFSADDRTLDAIWARNENWLQAALVIWSIVNLSTIPLTSTVCAYAAVRFTQYSSAGRNLTLRQTLVLADRGWINIPFLAKVIFNYKKHGRNAVSRFVLIAIALHFLGKLASSHRVVSVMLVLLYSFLISNG
jgi:hypothetical protein